MKTIIKIADIPIGIELQNDGYLPAFSPYITSEEPVFSISITMDDIQKVRERRKEYAEESDQYIEYMELYNKIADKMLNCDRAGFHGVAFLWQGKAWIFTALSGTGKTTQYVLWKSLFGEEIQMINGDKPFLSFYSDEIILHPSPWAGKECLSQKITAPLGGIILLEQSKENKISRLSPSEAAGMLFLQFMFSRENAEDVRKICELEEKLLTKIPVWKLMNRGDKESAKLCHDTLWEEK